MQEYYNSISKQKRIAFVDNLTDLQARTISAQYPFAICFASNISDEQPLPVIWYEGRRYGFTKVDSSAVMVGDTSISLLVDNDGVLKLAISEKIDNYYLDNIQELRDINNYNSWYEISAGENQTYTLYSLFNTFKLNYKFTKNDIIIPDAFYTINYVSSENNYYQISNNNNQYILTVKNSSDSVNNVSSYIIVNGRRISSDLSCSFVYVPDYCNWFINGSSYNDYYTAFQNQTLNIQFNFDDSRFLTLSDNFKLSLKCTCNNQTYTIPNVNQNTNIYNQISSYINNSTSYKLEVIISDIRYNTQKTLQTSMTITSQDNIDVIYIGHNLSDIPTEMVRTNSDMILNYTTAGVQGWHALTTYNFNDKDIDVDQNTIIIIPSSYKLVLPIYNDASLTNPIDDTLWKSNNYVTINNTQYVVYKYNTDDFGSLSNPKLLSIIKKIN